jgi:hypothetical protein
MADRQPVVKKAYVGDGCYVEIERGMLKLTAATRTEHGEHVMNTIYLEPKVFYELARFFDRAKLQGYEPEPCPYCGRLP